MNATHRLLNRTVVFLVGLLGLAAGVAVVLTGTLPAAADTWRTIAADSLARAGDLLRATPLGDTGHSWLLLAAAALAVVLAVLAVVLVVSPGGGRTATLLRDGDHGVTIDAAVADRAVSEALADHPDVLAAKVAAYSVRGTTVLKVTVSVRQGSSPRRALDDVTAVVRAWDRVLGRSLPVLVEVGSGLRTRFSRPARAT